MTESNVSTPSNASTPGESPRVLVKTLRVSTEVYTTLQRMKRVTRPGYFETFDEVLARILRALGEDS